MDFNADFTDENQPKEVAYKAYDNGFAKAASVLGIIAFVTTFLGLATIPIALGGIAVILALLSRGKGEMSNKAITGLVFGAIGIIINILLMCYIVWLFIKSPTYRQIMNNQFESIYGYTINEMIEGNVGGGFNLEEYLK